MASTVMVLRTAILSFLAAYYFPAVYRWPIVFGFFRTPGRVQVAENDLIVIEDTVHCEDIHQHGDWLFTACEDDLLTRFSWFPPLTVFDDPVLATRSQGSIHVIDPKSFKSRRLQFQDFKGPFVTHGIDVVSDRNQEGAVYIFAVNHVPNPEYVEAKIAEQDGKEIPHDLDKARSQIEVFHHVLGSSTAKWIRSLWHPLITTPNDILAASPTSVYVTNDHYYREGHLRTVEDLYHGAKWSGTVHVQINDLSSQKNSSAGIDVSVALTGLHNNNGLGHGRSDKEILIGSAASGGLHLAELTDDKNHPIRVSESILIDSTIDNPFYYKDPYPSKDNDASGFVLGGLSKAADLAGTARDPSATNPVIVWFVQPAQITAGKVTKWKKQAIFEDDGSRIRSSSAAMLLPISPELDGEPKKAWLVVTGFASKNMIAVKVDIAPLGWEGSPPDEL